MACGGALLTAAKYARIVLPRRIRYKMAGRGYRRIVPPFRDVQCLCTRHHSASFGFAFEFVQGVASFNGRGGTILTRILRTTPYLPTALREHKLAHAAHPRAQSRKGTKARERFR